MGKTSQYQVQLASLADGHYERDFVIDSDFFAAMGNTEILGADVKVHLDLVKKHEAYDCTFTCNGTLEIPCDRCLEPMEHEVDTTYHVTVKYGAEYDDSRDDVLVIPDSEIRLDVAPMIYDTLLLTIPLRHIHAPGQCDASMAQRLEDLASPSSDDDDDTDDDDLD